MKTYKTIFIFLILSINSFAVNPGDTGDEAWRDFGIPADEQKLLDPIGYYYPSLVPHSDQMLVWSFEHNCITCMDFHGLPDHDPSMPGGHGFSHPKPPYRRYVYVRLINKYIGDGVIHFKYDDDKWMCLGQADLPPYVPMTLKINFGEREDIPITIQSAVDKGVEDWKMGEWRTPTTYFTGVITTNFVEHDGTWYTNTVHESIKLTNITSLGTIYWAEYHLDGEVTRVEYNEGGYDKFEPIPAKYSNLPDKQIVNFDPCGDTPSISFIAKPTKYKARWSHLRVERYNLLSSNDLTTNQWYLSRYLYVYGTNLVTIPLKINKEFRQYFYKITDDSVSYTLVPPNPVIISNITTIPDRANLIVELIPNTSNLPPIPEVQIDIGTNYWLNITSNVRHNKSCRYYNNTANGRWCDETEGTPCSICMTNTNLPPIIEDPIIEDPIDVGTNYWLNITSNVRHNKSCRYYNNTANGRWCDETEGTPCSICGGE